MHPCCVFPFYASDIDMSFLSGCWSNGSKRRPVSLSAAQHIQRAKALFAEPWHAGSLDGGTRGRPCGSLETHGTAGGWVAGAPGTSKVTHPGLCYCSRRQVQDLATEVVEQQAAFQAPGIVSLGVLCLILFYLNFIYLSCSSFI